MLPPMSESRHTPAVETAGLGKSYGPNRALADLDLGIEPGEVYGYLGPNGAGKTTTIRLLLGLHRPSAGRRELFGIDAWADPVAAHRRVAYVAGEPFLWPALTGAETFEFLARLRGGDDAAYRDELVDRFKLDADKKVRALSKGNRQKVQLIAALASRADLLILDEPTSGLDPLMEVAFRESVAEAQGRGQTVFLSSHILSEVEALCDRVGILSERPTGRRGHARRSCATSPPTRSRRPSRARRRSCRRSRACGSSASGENALRCEVSGPMRPLLAALAELPVVALTQPRALAGGDLPPPLRHGDDGTARRRD